MTAYCTIAELKREMDIQSLDVLDDAVLETLIIDASRAVDTYCGRRFYATPATETYDVPSGRVLWLHGDWLGVSAVVNGDGASIAASAWQAYPVGERVIYGVRLRDSAVERWLPASSGDTLGVITVSGSTGYVDRAASDAESQRIVAITRRAAIIIASAYYRKRFGASVDAATITPAGVVLTPQGIPRDAAELLSGLRYLP